MRQETDETPSLAGTAFAHLDRTRWAAARPFVVVGVAGIIAGGFVAAATAPSPSENGSWAAAYLVLVVGVAQIALGSGLAVLATRVPSRLRAGSQALGWNIANAAVMCGTLLDVRALLYAGSALLVVTLIGFMNAVGGGLSQGDVGGAWPILGYRAVVVVLLISIPVGCILTAVHPSS